MKSRVCPPSVYAAEIENVEHGGINANMGRGGQVAITCWTLATLAVATDMMAEARWM